MCQRNKKSRGGKLPSSSDRGKWTRMLSEFQYRKVVSRNRTMDDGNTHFVPTKVFLKHVVEVYSDSD